MREYAKPLPDNSRFDPLVIHCLHARCVRAGLCRHAGPNRTCLGIAPLRLSLLERLMQRFEEQLGRNGGDPVAIGRVKPDRKGL
ncbi:MAG TPA: hypothetical protein VK844_01750 [Hyphomicrobiales bacterium]|nr:hypothetical protein [Hyphomicrobiales bacterium]